MTDFVGNSVSQNGVAQHCVAMDALTLYFSGDEQAALDLSQRGSSCKVNLEILEKAAMHVSQPELAQPLRLLVIK